MSTECFVKFPFFDLGEFVLREINESDALHYLAYISLPDVSKTVPDYLVPKSLKQSVQELRYWKDLFDSHRGFFWAIAKKNNNKLIGTIGFNFMSLVSKKGEINYDLHPDYWGRGIMTAALAEVLEFSSEIGLTRIQATVIEGNERSVRVLEKAGFELEGLLRSYEYSNGVHKNSYMYSKLLS